MTVIKIKRGPTVPTTSNLESYELGFVTSSGAENLYINNGGTITRLGIKVITGTNAPTTQGVDNDIYVQYTTSGNDTEIDAIFVKVSGSWIELPTGGASVLMGTTDPTAAMGEDGNLYVKYHIDSNVPSVDGFFVKISGAWASVSSGSGATYLELTQLQYDALTPTQKMNGTIYFITDVNGDGSQFQPIIYSTTEREIGVWTDGKPLYEKTYIFNSTLTLYRNTWTTISELDDIAAIVDKVINGDGYFYVSAGGGYQPLAMQYSGGHIQAQIARYIESSSVTQMTIRYTKSTDTAGSGIWTPQGVPAVHYSTDEQIVGTWIDGSTVFEKTIFLSNYALSYGENNISLGIGNISKVVSCELMLSNSTKTNYRQVTFNSSGGSDSLSAKIDISEDKLKLTAGEAWASPDLILTLRYTKTNA